MYYINVPVFPGTLMQINPASFGSSIPLESSGDEARQYERLRTAGGIAHAETVVDNQPLKAERLVHCEALSLPFRQELQSLLRQRHRS